MSYEHAKSALCSVIGQPNGHNPSGDHFGQSMGINDRKYVISLITSRISQEQTAGNGKLFRATGFKRRQRGSKRELMVVSGNYGR